MREWMIAAGIVGVLLFLLPVAWKRIETVAVEANYRLPFRLGNDYWMYARLTQAVCADETIPIIGDSVVWGHYVSTDQTLSHHLNELAAEDRFANLGVDGIHPAAMTGLINYYGRAVSGRKVILHCNLLWTSSEQQDLQTTKEFPFNHPELVPQFFPKIPCYRRSISDKLDIVVRRRLPYMGWARHMRIAYFSGDDLPAWTLEHPYHNPLKSITLELPSPGELPFPEPVAKPWVEKKMGRFAAQWVDLKSSIQWRSFRDVVAILQRRGNRVFVLLGPLNEHMLAPESREIYATRKADVEAWLREHRISCFVPETLPSAQYADASHPLGDGYARLAEKVTADKAFRLFCGLKFHK